jgi:hypothetical protein
MVFSDENWKGVPSPASAAMVGSFATIRLLKARICRFNRGSWLIAVHAKSAVFRRI